MKKRKIKKKPIIILVLILLVSVGIVCYFVFFNKDEKEDVIKVKNVDTIEEYGYTLSDNATKYYKDLFNKKYYDECLLDSDIKVIHDNEEIKQQAMNLYSTNPFYMGNPKPSKKADTYCIDLNINY